MLLCLATGAEGRDWKDAKPLVGRYLGDLKIAVMVYEVYRKGVAAAE